MNKKPITKLFIFNLLKKIKRFNLGNEKILLDKSMNRFFFFFIKSKINLPPFNNSAVDGYALCKNDIINNKNKLDITQRIVAGQTPLLKLKKGEVKKAKPKWYRELANR